MRERAWPWAGPTLVLAGLLSSWFFLTPLRPWPDQGVALEAAVRHARGEGLVTSRPGPDLARQESSRLTYFPPLYPLLVSGLLRLGLDLATAVKAINALALLAGCWGWCVLIVRQTRSPALRALGCVLLVIGAGGVVPKGGTTDYLLWAGLPFWIGAMLAAFEEDRAAGRALRSVALAGLLGCGLVGVRWAALFLVPAAAGFWLWPGRSAIGWRRRAALAAVAAAPLLATYVLITTVNRHLSGGQGSLLSFVQPRWDWANLLTLYPFEALFAVPLGLEPLLGRIWRGLDPQRAHLGWALLFRLFLPGLALAALAIRAWRSGALAKRQPFVRIAVATLVALLAFLSYMSVRYSWSFADWTYLAEPRYYRPVWPLAALLWLTLLDALPEASRLRRGSLVVLAVAALYLLQAQARWTVARLVPDESWELVQRIRAVTGAPGLHVVCDNDVSDLAVEASPRLRARLYPAVEETAALTASAPVHLWLVWRPAEPTAYVREADYDRKRFEALRTRFGARLAWRSSSGAYELYSAEVPASR